MSGPLLRKIRRSFKGHGSGKYRRVCLVFIICLGMTSMALSESGVREEETAIDLDKLKQEPKTYLGRLLVVEGVLEARGQGSRPPFLLRSESGAAVEVTPWAPIEIYRPREGAARFKSMTYFVGKRLLLTGRLTLEGDKYILRVTSAKEL